MLGNLMDPRGLAAVMPSQPPGLPAVAPVSLADTMGDLLPPGVSREPEPEPSAPTAPIPGGERGNLLPSLPPPNLQSPSLKVWEGPKPDPRGNLLPSTPPRRPNLLPPSADGGPPVIPATAHEAPVDKRQAFNYIMGLYNTAAGMSR